MTGKIVKVIRADSHEGKRALSALSRRTVSIPEEIEIRVKDIIETVKSQGDEALTDFTRQFDCPEFTPSMIRVSEEEIDRAFDKVDALLISSIQKARDQIDEFHRRQLPESWFMTRENGVILGQMVHPVDAAGLYVPGGQGGKTPLVSSVLMNGIPARIAGVNRIVLCTPPGPDGFVSPALLVAARLTGIHEVYRVGSAWAIAALAYGTETIKPVDVVAGPGNIYVTAAKKLVSGTVAIDMIAGPSEILIIADASAPPAFVAADMLSQAEHDPLATSILVTTSERLAIETANELEHQLARLERAETARKSLEDNGLIIIASTTGEACKIANSIGPEHLELMVEDPWSLVPSIRHAGAIFLGRFSPEPIGDYIAGPNHVLPTMGTARFSSALGVETFMKKSSLIYYTEEGFEQDADDVMRLAQIEGLTAHRQSVEIRKKAKG
ncbi:MAG: histidinol dehydrogenase [Thermodesulfobacteria bacterium]|nr:histidinol dehydrogenase [Thermodesulfobacteriota bacterium]